MASSKQVCIQFDKDTLQELDEYAARIRKREPGVTVNRTGLVRGFVLLGLEADRKRRQEGNGT